MKKPLAMTLICAVGIASQSTLAATALESAQKSTFLSAERPSTPLLKTHPLYPRFCTALQGRAQCPSILSGGSAGGPALDLPLQSYLPNVRVEMFVQTISNEIVSNGGAEGTDSEDLQLFRWQTSSPEADTQKGGPYNWTVPAPGEIYDGFGWHGSSNGIRIYDALVFNACDSLTSFDMSHDAEVTEDGAVIGAYSGSDSTTIDSTGWYNVSYIVRATDDEGGVSDFHIGGKVAVTCSGLNALP